MIIDLFLGIIDIYVGGQQPNQETRISSNVLQGQITVIGSNNMWQTNLYPMSFVYGESGKQVVFKLRQTGIKSTWIELMQAYHVVL